MRAGEVSVYGYARCARAKQVQVVPAGADDAFCLLSAVFRLSLVPPTPLHVTLNASLIRLSACRSACLPVLLACARHVLILSAFLALNPFTTHVSSWYCFGYCYCYSVEKLLETIDNTIDIIECCDFVASTVPSSASARFPAPFFSASAPSPAHHNTPSTAPSPASPAAVSTAAPASLICYHSSFSAC